MFLIYYLAIQNLSRFMFITLKGNDSHLFVSSFMKYGHKHSSLENITCIPNNKERYISFYKKIKVDGYININGLNKTNKILFKRW